MRSRWTVFLFAIVLIGCKSNQGGSDSAESRGFGDEASPVARARIQERIDNIKYQSNLTLVENLERLAAYGDMAIPQLVAGLQSPDASTRMGCAYVLGRIGNTKVIPDLLPLLQDESAIVRYEAAYRLGTLGSREGYGVLVDGLEDDNIRNRYNCFRGLQELTNRDFGYSHNASPELRRAAVARWREWLAQIQAEKM